ncbi:O-antigen ligase family protein [Providencia rettgeri]|uniref:O-antigen ligase family protein n=1 Tax=Providencia TaxID=586 RepID=UPI00234BEADA|nr:MULTISPECIES: O-antigen ligase family protein [unclassified Providencia]MDB9566398.1 O-antigen ligase family protein [Providencia rettgeri]
MTKQFFKSNGLLQTLNWYIPITILLLCIISLILVPFKPNITSKIFNLTGFIAIITVLASPKHYFKNKSLIIAIPLFFIGLSHLAWVELYKTSDSLYKNVYYGYFQMAKIAIFGSFILLCIDKIKGTFKLNRLHFLTALFIQLSVFLYALYQAIYFSSPRVELSFGNASNATGAAYAMIFLSLYSQTVFLQSKIKFNYVIYFASLVLTYISIILTETRAAILVYPFVSIFIFSLHSREINTKVKRNKIYLAIPILVLLICGLFFSDSISSRMSLAAKEGLLYIENGKSSSVGDRLSMIKAGIYSSNDNFFWQSAEERNNKISELAKIDRSLQGATKHFHAHLHNDLVETLSTKGWISGVMLTLIFYLAIILYGIKNDKNPFILGFAISLIILGFSDTLIISKQVSLTWCLVLILIISCVPIKNNHITST